LYTPYLLYRGREFINARFWEAMAIDEAVQGSPTAGIDKSRSSDPLSGPSDPPPIIFAGAGMEEAEAGNARASMNTAKEARADLQHNENASGSVSETVSTMLATATPSTAATEADKAPDAMSNIKAEDAITVTPASKTRGGTRGRPRGRASTRGSSRGGGRGGKRKREDRDDGDSDSSEEMTTPAATMTKSGRSIQKPTSFVPPPEPSPVSGVKRKRTYRRNPESAVCKVCLRGTSPASNMIVFCDGCNTPYHRYCHHPPIDQSVVDEVDKEWYCKQCESQRFMPVPEAEVASFVSAEGASAEQVCRPSRIHLATADIFLATTILF
jgi:hypothetical protein